MTTVASSAYQDRIAALDLLARVDLDDWLHVTRATDANLPLACAYVLGLILWRNGEHGTPRSKVEKLCAILERRETPMSAAPLVVELASFFASWPRPEKDVGRWAAEAPVARHVCGLLDSWLSLKVRRRGGPVGGAPPTGRALD
jgi:hypothetical protein